MTSMPNSRPFTEWSSSTKYYTDTETPAGWRDDSWVYAIWVRRFVVKLPAIHLLVFWRDREVMANYSTFSSVLQHQHKPSISPDLFR